MKLYCVRHGESTHNATGRIQGQADIPLSEFGRRQGTAIASALSQLPIDALYSSPLRRAWETAEIIAQQLQLEIRCEERLKEIHAGIFQNRSRPELEAQYPAELARWVAGDPDFVIPGGESRRSLTERGAAAFRDIASAGHEHAVLVSHGRLLAVTIRALTQFSRGEAAPSLDNGSITILTCDRAGHFELEAFDQVEHLREVGLAGKGDL